MKLNSMNNINCVKSIPKNAGYLYAWIECIVLHYVRLGFVNFETFIKYKHIYEKIERMFRSDLSIF